MGFDKFKKMITIKEPKTENEFKQYYDLRYIVLRKPWKQPKGSERDELENKSMHVMACDGNKVVGVGRIHFNSKDEAQIRYMAVDDAYQGKGIGKSILEELEKKAKEKSANRIVLNSRENTVRFYEKASYYVIGKAHVLFGSIQHYKMRKMLN